MDAYEILKETPFFSEVLDESELKILSDHARTVVFDKGTKLIEEDGPGHSMFVIVKGEAEVTVADEDGAVATLGAGGILGEMSLLTGAPRSATVTATETIEALEVDKSALANVLWMSPTLVDRFATMLMRRQRELDKMYGGVAWGMLRPGKAELTSMIRDFLQTTE
ncbi:MAG: cyclic nucleotide-binding domain-containing protein [Bauldia sp.]|uniref:cyclic nucleotide-binding domain-containing protein n=1 Tax=Bauldia sp. TaxID=2575872 RepID=UPI001E092321|nr:cyclic nucleotide-binding domain-containing protein [Bauldia sp.]MCB1495993.1 cyclic nucleotide-binding domain-containing protein [Bauldia sp.]